MLIDNIHFLRDHYPEIRNIMLQNEEQLKEAPLEVVESKIGLPTIQVRVNERPLFIHSKYDPIKEAERLLKQYENEMDEYEHIFFYGLGFGYHVESILKEHPNKTFTLYEPQPEMFYQYMNHRNIASLPIKKLNNLFIEWNPDLGSQFIEQFAFDINEKILLVAHPAYIRAFPSKYEQFTSEFKNKVQKKGMSHAANIVFSKRWVLNSLMNLKTTMETPNLLIDKKDVFKGNPVLLVSAGPSLADEYENLRYIKENGLAYIFAVGSANKALVANDILPDAVLTYDPQAHNYKVFEPMLEKYIDSVPMIYGTSVGYETLEYYKGPKLHVITSQDTMTPYFYKETLTQQDIVDDAFSIAIVTLQLLTKMDVGSIILVGQNFAFRDNLYYSKDIRRGNESAEVQEKDVAKSLYVEDVYGNQVKTNQSFNQMRLAMEQYIQSAPNMEIINTTKGGAAIEGAPFLPLEQIIQERLQENTVEGNWHLLEDTKSLYDKQKKEVLIKENNQFIVNYGRINKVIREINGNISKKNIKGIEKNFVSFDKQLQVFINNAIYSIVVHPVVKPQFEKMQEDVSKLNKNTNMLDKAKQLVDASEAYLQSARQVFNEMSPFANEAFRQVDDEKFQRYKSDCGVFAYSKGWKKNAIKVEEKQTGTTLTYHFTDSEKESIKFRFFGTSFKVLAGTRKDFAEKIQIKVDGKEETFSTKSNINSEFVWKMNEIVYEKNHLTNEMHEVEIILNENKSFIFNGVEINQVGRLYHVDEVTSVEELEIGKRIRCHYTATFNQVGEFNGLGEATKQFIPPKSSVYPDGDFYFIMVDENEEEGKKMIADRNVQHSISWNTLEEYSIPEGKDVVISSNKVFIRLLDGGSAFIDKIGEKAIVNYNLGAWPKDNEWDKYINDECHFQGIASWCNNAVVVGLHNRFNINDKFETKITTEESTKRSRVLRGNVDKTFLLNLNKKLTRKTEGFRPLIMI